MVHRELENHRVVWKKKGGMRSNCFETNFILHVINVQNSNAGDYECEGVANGIAIIAVVTLIIRSKLLIKEHKNTHICNFQILNNIMYYYTGIYNR